MSSKLFIVIQLVSGESLASLVIYLSQERQQKYEGDSHWLPWVTCSILSQSVKQGAGMIDWTGRNHVATSGAEVVVSP